MREDKEMRFCKFCGQEVKDGMSFCPGCGRPCEDGGGAGSGNSFGQAGAGGNQNPKKDWREYLTMENIERYAPVAALVPVVMMLVVGIVGWLFLLLFGYYGLGYTIGRIIVGLLKFVFCIAVLAAAGGLVYVAVKTKDINLVKVWVAPAATVAAFISCLGIAFSWTAVAWIFGLISVALGLEMLSRITILGNPMDSAMNPRVAFEMYRQYYRDYRAKYPTTKDLERAGMASPTSSYFDGSGIELFGYTLLAGLVSAVTCGIAAPWMICKIYQWRISHTVINGRRLTFDGSGASLLGHWILWEILTVITCGIYAFFAHVALRKWELGHTYIDGEPVMPNTVVSSFDGNSFQYFGYSLLGGLLVLLTCGIASPWVMCMLQGWDTKHQIINNRRLTFSGSGLGFLGEWIIIALLTLITCGLYSSWGIVRMNKYIIRHTDFC